jgi:hypothetical protein
MYPQETVVAEKFEAMIRFGVANGRIKDFRNIWVTARTFPFDLATLTEAVGGTLRRRQTAILTELPVALTPRFADAPNTQGLRAGFLRRNPSTLPPPPFGELLYELRRFFGPVLAALALPEAGKERQVSSKLSLVIRNDRGFSDGRSRLVATVAMAWSADWC